MTTDGHEDPSAVQLSEADRKQLAKEIVEQMKTDFYSDLGRGFFKVLMRAVWATLLMVAGYGAIKAGVQKP